ncbi:putative major Facilitator Superfamily protein [Rosellinia necatrix]|uniref:Putative major Facilitator Superfamily protein n=1 Tax=Rosellinia necatrix TaxID=77044 RepID=A0A1W2TRZ0_ROSNE|nr:putative major Facilitator Superfamily protein [Rosellinia necatrix]
MENLTVFKPTPSKENDSEEDRIHGFGASEGYEVDVGEVKGDATIKLASDGRTRLIPQPSEDAADPLNWSQRKKNLILFIVAFTALLPDYGSATGAVTLIPQAQQWHMSEDEVNHSQAGNVFMLGAGGIFVVAFSAYFGRLPVMFYFLVVALATAAWCAGATNFASFETARILNGFFSTVSQVNGLIFVQDMFFFHERARKINIWASFFILSPYLGPLLAAFQIETKPWPTPFWVYTAETALALALTIVFVEETYYDRRIAKSDQPDRGNRITSLLGIAQWKSRGRRNTFSQACMRPVRAISKPTVLISCFYYFLTFAWVVGINTTLSIFLQPVYGFGPKQIGFFYFTPIVAVIIGEIVGHWLHDIFAKQYIRTHNGRFEPEARLRAIMIALPFTIIGLVLLGQSLENRWHFMVTSVSWGLYVFSTMIITVAISSYNLDCYPEASGEVSAWVNNSRSLGGFIVSYFQVTWANAQGTKASFGIQAAVCVLAFLLIVLLMWRGKAMRIWSGPLRFATA